MNHKYTISETGIMLFSMPQGSFDMSMAWIGNSFRIVVKNAANAEIIYLRQYHFQNVTKFSDALIDLKQIAATDLLFSDTYRNIKIGLASRVELFPVAHFNKEASEFISQKLKDSDILAACETSYTEMEFYRAFFPNAEIKLLAATWLDLILPESNSTKLFVHVSGNILWVAYAENTHEMELFSTFEFKTTEDFTYFINLAAEEMKLDKNKIALILSGDLEQNSALQKAAYTYFQEVHFFENRSLTYSRLFDNYPKQQNVDLMSL